MKKYIIMGLFSLFSCNEKYYSDSESFNKLEKKANISSVEAFEIYKSSFDEIFDVDRSPYTLDSFFQDIYIYDGFYYIGFANKNDKRSRGDIPLYFLAKINMSTGEISIVK